MSRNRFGRYLMSWIIWPAPQGETPGESWVRAVFNLAFVVVGFGQLVFWTVMILFAALHRFFA